jgi:hypothetical protein
MRAILSIAIAIAALSTSTASAATAIPTLGEPSPTVSSAPVAGTQGIIMRDGGICNPRWGC